MREEPQHYADGDELIAAGSLLIPVACILLLGIAILGGLIVIAIS